MDTCQVADGLCGQLPSFCCSIFKLNKLASLPWIFRGPLWKIKKPKALGERSYESEIQTRKPWMYKELGCLRNGFCMIFFFFFKKKSKTKTQKTPRPHILFWAGTGGGSARKSSCLIKRKSKRRGWSDAVLSVLLQDVKIIAWHGNG